MHSLEQIERANEQGAANQGLTAARRAGKHCVAHYTGLHLVGFTEHDTARGASLAQIEAQRARQPGDEYHFLAPLTGQTPRRDQSEDRALPALPVLGALVGPQDGALTFIPAHEARTPDNVDSVPAGAADLGSGELPDDRSSDCYIGDDYSPIL